MQSQLTLADMVRGVRAESGRSLNVAQGVAERDAIVSQLQTKQTYLYYEYDWPFLLDETTFALTVNTNTYPFPALIAFDFINDVWASTQSTTGWAPVTYGIGPVEYAAKGVGAPGWPVVKWRIKDDQMELWPAPQQAGFVLVRGRRALAPLVDDTDMSTLDGTMLVLAVAADLLAAQKASNAPARLAQAQRHLRNVARRQGGNKREPFPLGGPLGAPFNTYQQPRIGLEYIPQGYGKGP